MKFSNLPCVSWMSSYILKSSSAAHDRAHSNPSEIFKCAKVISEKLERAENKCEQLKVAGSANFYEYAKKEPVLGAQVQRLRQRLERVIDIADLEVSKYQAGLYTDPILGKRNLSLEKLFNHPCPFKISSHKFSYPPSPLVGAVMQVDRREKPSGERTRASNFEFTGEKIHINVRLEQVSMAFNAMMKHLLNDDCPFDSMKIVNPQYVDGSHRVGAGAQVTCYIKSDTRAWAVADFIRKVGADLRDKNIGGGVVPNSDARLDGEYFSYRHQDISSRYGKSTSDQEGQQFYCELLGELDVK